MATYYVSTTGNDTTGDGSSGAPWKTIQKAVDTVSTGTAHTILVAPGTYAETTYNYLYINRNDLRITIQANGGTVTLSTANTDHVVRLHTALDTGTSSVTLVGLTLTPATVADVGVVYVSSVACPLTMTNCVLNPSGTAINVAASASAAATRILTLNNCTLNAGAAYGINADDLAELIVDGCTIGAAATRQAILASTTNAATRPTAVLLKVTDCILGQGIQALTHWDSVYIARNTIEIDKASGSTVGIQVGGDTSNNALLIGRTYIAGNTISYVGAHVNHGILVGPGAVGADVIGNEVYLAEIGIVLKGDCTVTDKLSSRARVIGNKVYGPRGIYLKGSSNNLVQHNTAVSTQTDGGALEIISETRSAVAYNTTDNTITDNVFVAAGTTQVTVFDHETGGASVRNFFDYNVLETGTSGIWRVGAGDAVTTKVGLLALWASNSLLNENDIHTLVADPLLVDPAAGDFSIPSNSPAFAAASDGGSIGGWQPDAALRYGATGVYGRHG